MHVPVAIFHLSSILSTVKSWVSTVQGGAGMYPYFQGGVVICSNDTVAAEVWVRHGLVGGLVRFQQDGAKAHTEGNLPRTLGSCLLPVW